MKLKSCMTLFRPYPVQIPFFRRCWISIYNGEQDQKTVEILSSQQ